MTEPSLRDQLQTSLGTSYTIQRELTGGAMSRVFVVRDESLGREVVIKVLPRELAAEMSVERFAREIKLAAALQHPHVLPVLSAGASEGLPYYTMPFVRGESLRGALSKGPMPVDDAIAVLRDVARALRYAHGEGVVHRDIKPENVLLSSGSAVVTDFGIAKALSASRTEAPGGTLTVVGTSIGTPAYMSPEQAAADPNVDHRADIYAWGVIAYELLAGRHPFVGKTTPQQYLAAHLAEQPASLRKVAPAVPAPLADVVMRTLEKEPDKRPSVDEILAALGVAATSTGEVAQSRPAPRWRVAAAAVIALGLISAGLAFWKGRAGASAPTSVMLAVLPFENQGPSEQDYFVDGLTDAVNGKLAGLAGVSVIDRRSTAMYRGTTKSVKEIGGELGVEYVLAAVVRWARGETGWRAQVMPTLVSTKDATTRWAGEPIVVSSDDPFSAQTEIATRVADALQLALGTDEIAALAAKPTSNTQAYDAYLRAKAAYEQSWRTSLSVRALDQVLAELKRAVALDPKFAKAWVLIAWASHDRARAVPGDTVSMKQALDAARRAAEFEREAADVALIRSDIAFLQGDRQLARSIIVDAVNSGLAKPELLVPYAFAMWDAGHPDSASSVMARAIRMSPRDVNTLFPATELAGLQKNWRQVERHARAIIAIDPTDERPWADLARMSRAPGDTAGIRRTLEEAFRYIPSPSNLLLVFMVYAGNQTAERFLGMTPEQLRIETLEDSVVTYYDNKADLFLAKRDLPRARIYHDSIIGKLEGRTLTGPGEPRLRLFLSNAYAWSGRGEDARAELERARAAARRANQVDASGNPRLDRRLVAGILSHLGDHEAALLELRANVGSNSWWTRKGLAMEPKLVHLRDQPAYAAFFREKD